MIGYMELWIPPNPNSEGENNRPFILSQVQVAPDKNISLWKQCRELLLSQKKRNPQIKASSILEGAKGRLGTARQGGLCYRSPMLSEDNLSFGVGFT